jgi:xanthine dehydrogenase YagS FAD-binding subunit
MMRSFEYVRATSLEEAMRVLAGRDHGGAPALQIIAGGTNLIDLMRADVLRPKVVVDVSRLPLHEIRDLPDGGLRLGALATNADTAYDERVQERYPLVAEAILAGASAQLRNMATNGGNLMQRTRCAYFYESSAPCNKREPGSGCGALDGVNRMHAILGASDHCIAVHPSDLCVALLALGAKVRVIGPGGERTIPFGDFHRLPGDTPELETNLAPDEIITAIDLPAKGFADHSAYLKVRDRASYAFALVSVAAALEIRDGSVGDARLALGGVAHKPWRDVSVEETLVGRPASVESFRAAAEVVMRDAKGLTHNAFKIELAKRAIVRALENAARGTTR